MRRDRRDRGAARPGADDIAAAFRLTGHFLARHVFEARGLEMPEARASYLALIARVVPPAEAAE
jgi:DNA repair protein RecO (recombination protein O)